MLQEEALKIKESLKDSSFDSSTAFNGWLEKWKVVYGTWDTRITEEADGFSIPTVNIWIERIP